jgi:hypothetical protein
MVEAELVPKLRHPAVKEHQHRTTHTHTHTHTLTHNVLHRQVVEADAAVPKRAQQLQVCRLLVLQLLDDVVGGLLVCLLCSACRKCSRVSDTTAQQHTKHTQTHRHTDTHTPQTLTFSFSLAKSSSMIFFCSSVWRRIGSRLSSWMFI